jgi:hypothetical protein
MNTSSSTHFAFYCTAITAAFALSMPEIPWLRPLGYAGIFACWVIFRGEQHCMERLPWLGLVLFGAMGIVIVNVTAPVIDQPLSVRPTIGFTAALILAWAACVYRQYRQWSSQRFLHGQLMW